MPGAAGVRDAGRHRLQGPADTADTGHREDAARQHAAPRRDDDPGPRPLEPITLLAKALRSRTARLLAGCVAASLLTVQLAFVVPGALASRDAAVRAIERAARLQVEAALREVPVDEADLGALAAGGALRSLVVRSPDGVLLAEAGAATPGAPSVEWLARDAEVPVRVEAALDADETGALARRDALRGVALALLVALVGALATLLATAHCLLGPLDGLAAALRRTRERGQHVPPEPIGATGSADLDPLAEEFDRLVEAQRQATRQVKVKQQFLEFAALNDTLTSLPNRLMFENTLKETVSQAVEQDLRFAVFLVDLDNFKFFNDQYGHLIGDKMVAEVGNRLRSMMRDIDLVARLDGDEFVVIQKDVPDRAAAERVAERLMKVATAPYEYRGFTLKAAVSVGISCFPLDVHAGHADELLGEEMVNNAAVALQEAKSTGKNRYRLFDETMRSRLTARIRLEQDLKLALAEEQFEVWYQPKIDIRTRKAVGAEALVRWRHPVDGLVSPDDFVPVAEESGMIIELGEWILRTACRQTHELQRSGCPGLEIAVNISAMQFTDGNLLPMVERALADSSLAPEYLELEITESAVMHDPEDVVHSLHELSRFGMRLAIDDFGTGYSSLAYLKRFPVDTLKIDRAFITDISDDDDVAIVEAVLNLGKHFEMKIVAEGVEDEAQLEFLESRGCDIAQGYFISRPMDFAAYARWLERWPHGVRDPRGDGAPAVPASNVLSLDVRRAG